MAQPWAPACRLGHPAPPVPGVLQGAALGDGRPSRGLRGLHICPRLVRLSVQLPGTWMLSHAGALETLKPKFFA